MSDVNVAAGPLERHNLEVVAAQWQGTNRHAMEIATALRELLPTIGAELTYAHAGASSQDGTYMELEITRRADRCFFVMPVLRPGYWMVLWLQEGALYHAETMSGPEGSRLFRRWPVITLDPNRPEVEGGV